MISTRGDDPDLDPVLGVPARKPVKDVDILAGVEVVDGPLAVDLERVLAVEFSSDASRMAKDSLHLDVDGAPPDIILAGLLVDDALVFGRTAGLLAREVDQGPVGRDDRALVEDRVLVQAGNGGIALVVVSADDRNRWTMLTLM